MIMSHEIDTHNSDHGKDAIRYAFLANTAIAVGSAAMGVMVGSKAMVGEALHDSVDALTHALDYFGYNAPHPRISRLARQASAVAIVGAASVFTYKTVAEFDDPYETLSWYAPCIAIAAAAVNRRVSSKFGHDHHEQSHVFENEPHARHHNLRASAMHAKVDAYLSPLVAAGVSLSWLFHSALFDRSAAIAAGVGTIVGNIGECKRAFSSNSESTISD